MTDTARQTETFWDRLGDIPSGMLGLTEDPRLVPMSHYADKDARTLWFITARETELAQAVAVGNKPALHVVSDGGEGLYARIHGKLSLSNDRAKLDELWNVVADSWFEGGKRDDDVALLQLVLSDAEIWATAGRLAFLYEIARSKVTGKTPDMGEHYTLRF